MNRLLWVYLTLCVAVMEGEDARLYLQLGHASGINCVAFSPNGRWALTGSSDTTARLWEVATGREIRRLDGHSGAVTSVTFSHTGRWALTGSEGGDAVIWDVTAGKEIRRMGNYSGPILSVALSLDERWALTGSEDHTAQLWDVATGKEIRRLKGHSESVNSVAFSPDGRLALTGSSDKTAGIWEVATGKEIRRLEGHAEGVFSVVFSSDGRRALTAAGLTARVWEVATGKELRRRDGQSEFSSDGRWALTQREDGIKEVWEVATGKAIRRLEGHSGEVNYVAFSPDGRWLLTTSDNTAQVWDVATGKEIRRLEGHSGAVESVAFSPDGRWALTGGKDHTAQLWEVATGNEIRRLKGHSESVGSVAFSTDSRWALTGSDDGTARVWEVDTGKEIRCLEGVPGGVMSVAFSPDGLWALTGYGNTARLWEVATGKEIRHLVEEYSVFDTVALSSDGRWALTGGLVPIVPLWEVATGKQIRRLEGHSEAVRSVAFSADSRWALTGSDDGTAQLWEVDTGKEIRRLEGHRPFRFVTFSPDGRRALTASLQDSTARVWEVATGREIQRLEGHSGAVTSASFSPDGRWVLTGSWDGSTRLWDAASGEWRATLMSSQEGGWAVVDPDGRFDTSDLDGGAPLHWILDSDPMRPLPLEIFMRDYYTPRLLPRILNGEKLAPLPRIGDIKNRVQPDVEIVNIEALADVPNRMTVAVRATSKSEKGQASGLQDLRLFRDGQMVGYREGPLKDDTYVFGDVQLPVSGKKVTLSAYAFNSQRIKSATVQREFEYTPKGQVKPKAFLVQIGVNHYQATGCELLYAVNDAHKLRDALEQRLRSRGLEVKAVELVATREISNATRGQIRKTLDAISKEATPDDVFFLSFSGHGYTTKGGQFYVLPADIQGSCGSVDEDLLKNAISADELAEWLRPIDAGEMTFILDSCYSARSVEANDFKPGPMGSRGLGQLAYDKRMRILAASQSDATAQEDSRLQQGLLSYVLTEQGLKEGKADWKPVDQQITIGEWLTYAADQVPKLNESAKPTEPSRGVRVLGRVIGRSQVPAVFDFSKKDEFVIQK